MGLFRRGRKDAPNAVAAIAPAAAMSGIDLVRFDLLLQTSRKLHEAGVDYASIEERASTDAISFNEALEAIYAERFHG